MNTINKIASKITSIASSRKIQVAVMVLTIALFVFAAGAPNATIGIGK